MATLEVVRDALDLFAASDASPVTDVVRVGLWDGAYDATGAVVNQPADSQNFVGSDSRRFYFRVTDPGLAGAGSVAIEWRTLFPTLVPQDAPAIATLTLTEVAPGVFCSRAVMVVVSDTDASEATNSGLPAGHVDAGLRSRGQRNHRLRVGSMFGFVEASYIDSSGMTQAARVPIFNRAPDERRVLPITVYVLRQGGAPVVPVDAAATLWSRDLRNTTEAYERIGIWLFTAPAANPLLALNHVTGGNPILYTACVVDAPAGVNANQIVPADVNTIDAAFPGLPDTIRVFIVGGGAPVAGGGTTFGSRGLCFVAPAHGTGFAMAHEIGHCLTEDNTVHKHYFTPNAPPGNRLTQLRALMAANAPPTGINTRIWDAPDLNGYNFYQKMRGSRFVKQGPIP